MIAFPPCKINLGLNVIRKRDDGYHDIETVFCPVPWTDALEVVRSESFSFTLSGLPVAGASDQNLCVKAYELLKEKHGIGPVSMHLHKAIPMGAGLGGGSSDAAHTLKLLDAVFELKLGKEKLLHYASLLGSDCPFFVYEKPAVGKGRGEILQEIAVPITNKFLVIVVPDVHISTAAAYGGVVPVMPERGCADMVSTVPVNQWKHYLVNDFEKSVIQTHPVIGRVKMEMYDYGAEYAAMSGSGSAVYGIFDRPVELPASLSRYPHWSGFLSLGSK
ncbi:MAG: 4-(cytidine 5'-diphospho)-2-C-methyl-D-erythritol kinase [Bacteroidota bacterium]|jgi:4-diphosphocytidyl-2-C-methyl-D-erythritol kinase|nr:MAG: 4-(cytidine 5'-diphospho)-2-C-methyl-D-erythritol kinase [Bacteroidota bacterium]